VAIRPLSASRSMAMPFLGKFGISYLRKKLELAVKSTFGVP
jgi:hypothetical protein